MIQNNGITLDLLLGLTKTDSVVGQVATTEMRPFSDLLAALVSSESAPNQGAAPLFAPILNGLGMNTSSQIVTAEGNSRLAAESPQFDTLSYNIDSEWTVIPTVTSTKNGDPLMELVPDDLSMPLVELAARPTPSIDSFAPPSLDDLPALLTANESMTDSTAFLPLLANRGVINPMAQYQMNGLPEGAYRILSVSIAGDRLELVLAPDQPQAEPIRVSLPAAILNTLAAQTGDLENQSARPISVRVALDQAIGKNSQVSDLLAKLSLKELRVESQPDQGGDPLKSSPATNTLKNTDAVTLTFRGGQSAQPFTLAVPVNRRTILTINKPATDTGHDLKATTLSTESGTQSALIDSTAPGLVKSRAAAPTVWPEAFDQNTPDFLSEAEMPEGRLTDLTTSLRPTGENTPLGERLMTSPVRFTLPDQIAQQLKPTGRSVSIMIEPEHLGKATLRLSISNQLVTARLTVDTPAAKAMVEQSLDQLTSQLAKAGVKVDLINVNVAGGDAHTNLFGQRQATLFERSRIMRRPFDPTFATTLNSSVEPSRPSLPSYVGPGGVNLFA